RVLLEAPRLDLGSFDAEEAHLRNTVDEPNALGVMQALAQDRQDVVDALLAQLPSDQPRPESRDLGLVDRIQRLAPEFLLQMEVVDPALRLDLRRLVLSADHPLLPEPSVEPNVEPRHLLSLGANWIEHAVDVRAFGLLRGKPGVAR